MDFDLQAFRRPCAIGFRVEVHDQGHRFQNCTFQGQHGNMRAHDHLRVADRQTCLYHLRGRPEDPCYCRRPKEDCVCNRWWTGSPLISFFTNWNAALRRRQRMIDEGATEVLIIAVWLKGLPGVYDAYSIASALDLRNNNNLDPFLHEVWIHGGISADSYRILAMFHGTDNLEELALRVDGLTMMVWIPGGFIHAARARTYNGRPDATDTLRNEIQARTGIIDNTKFLHLALSIGNVSYTVQNNNASTEIIAWPFGGMNWRVAPIAAV
ncbi:hypothetical protein MAJ_10966, partial [Metarhizium majus ARSEF 297]